VKRKGRIWLLSPRNNRFANFSREREGRRERGGGRQREGRERERKCCKKGAFFLKGR
jgi:hypothetical protein